MSQIVFLPMCRLALLTSADIDGKMHMVPSGFFSTQKIVQIWKGFSALLRTEVPVSYLQALYSVNCKYLEVHLMEDFDLATTASAGAIPSGMNICSAPPVSQADIAQFKSFERSYAVNNVRPISNANPAAAPQSNRRTGCGARAFDLTDTEGVSFTQCTFKCPAPWCAAKFSPKATLGGFLLYMEEPAHAKWLQHFCVSLWLRTGLYYRILSMET